jgi:TonB family protein
VTVQAIRWETWVLNEEADRRFRRVLAYVGIPALLIALLITFITLEVTKVEPPPFTPPPLVQLIKPPPPPPHAAPKETPKPSPHVAQQVAKKVEIPKPVPKPQPSARELAQKTKEMTEIQKQLSTLNENVVTGPQTLVNGVITSKGAIPNSGDIAASAAANSGGIGSAGNGSVTGQQSGTGLGSRRTGAVASPLGGGKGGQGEAYAAGRNITEVQEVFDRNKTGIVSIYNRAARENTNISDGTIFVRLNIAPDGSVTECSLVSSTFHDPDFERKVLERVRTLHFKPKNVPPFIVASYPIQFHPM